MGAGTLRRHRAIQDAAVGATPARSREQLLEEALAAEKARGDALQAEVTRLLAERKAATPPAPAAPAQAPAPAPAPPLPAAEAAPVPTADPAPRGARRGK